MTLIVEDGTGMSTANSFVDVATADAYLSARGITTWAGLQQPEKEQALIRAADFMRLYRWQGVRSVAGQALDWPRMYVRAFDADVAINSIPTDVKNAQIELAWRGAGGPLLPDIKGDDTGRVVTKKVEKVGPIDVETTYASRGQMAVPTFPVWSAVLVILDPYLRNSMGVYR